jgi:hypothetical protein
VHGERERAKVWKEHMERVMNEKNEWDGVVDVDVVHGPIDRVTMKEVMTAIKAMKLGKATGVSEVAGELSTRRRDQFKFAVYSSSENL